MAAPYLDMATAAYGGRYVGFLAFRNGPPSAIDNIGNHHIGEQET